MSRRKVFAMVMVNRAVTNEGFKDWEEVTAQISAFVESDGEDFYFEDFKAKDEDNKRVSIHDDDELLRAKEALIEVYQEGPDPDEDVIH